VNLIFRWNFERYVLLSSFRFSRVFIKIRYIFIRYNPKCNSIDFTLDRKEVDFVPNQSFRRRWRACMSPPPTPLADVIVLRFCNIGTHVYTGMISQLRILTGQRVRYDNIGTNQMLSVVQEIRYPVKYHLLMKQH
jgi:hypothetical protein